MKEQILQPVEDVWHHHCAALNDALAETISELKNVLRLDEYHRHGHDADHLERALGPFAATNLDVGSLSRVLGESGVSRAMAPERLKRVQELIQTLGEMKEAGSITPADFATVEIAKEEHAIRELAEEHLNRIAQVFRTLRIAQLEIRSKYESETHDAVFADFNWRNLGPGELRSCPPFVVMARLDDDGGAQLLKMMSLLESGMPIKIVAHRSSLREVYAPASDTSVPSTMTIETLPLAMRGVYFLQTCVAAPDFQERLFEGLTAPRPGVISVLCQRNDEVQAAFQSRAERAVRARAFPMSHGFVMCIDLSSNPSPDMLWTNETLSGQDAQGQPVEVEEAFTFAHFAASEPEFAAELTDPPAVADDLIPLTDYLGFSRRQRVGKLPFISLAGKDGSIVRKVVSPMLALQCSDRLHLWRTLQEISGIDNPYVNTARAKLEQESGAQQEALVKNMQQEMEKEAARREQAAVASAMRRLVVRLTGVEPPP
ncbi:MAG: hypothetical protein JRE73_13705 [Deltaproteobacteria bacterium]|nr:hypothetical protein [Deltaproteobacteria bacterium]